MRKIWGVHQDKIPKWQKYLLFAFVPILKLVIKHVYKIVADDRETFEAAQQEVNAVMKEVRQDVQTFQFESVC